MSDLEDLIDLDDLDPAAEARLRRVHDLLVQAGPPAELSPALEQPASAPRSGGPPRVGELPRRGELIPFPLPRRRLGSLAVVAAAAAAVVFGGGYLLGHSKAKTEAFATKRVVPMHGIDDSRAAIRVSSSDSAGNRPMLVSVTGLPRQSDPKAYYELWLSRNGKPIAPCGGFRVTGKTTTFRLTVPYTLRGFDGWIVTAVKPGDRDPGRIVMRT
jgi:hypothetical protein